MKVTKYISCLFCLISISVPAQNVMTSSPYSMYGIGDITSGIYGQNAAMGGVAYGMRSPLLINSDNPAGLTGIDSCKLLMDISVFLKNEYYKSGSSSNQTLTGNFSALSLGGRIMPRWYMAVGLTPYSTVGYYFKGTQPLEGSPGSYYTSTFQGDGGLSRVYMTQAFALTRNLSLGVNLNYVFGNMTQSETQESMSVTQKMYGHTVYADLGIQYHKQLAQNSSFVIGAVYGYTQSLNLENTLTVKSSSSQNEQEKKKIKQNLPRFTGIGGSLVYRKWTYALDYTFREYSSLKADDSRITFSDTHELRLGVRYFPDGFSSSSYWSRVAYKAGISLSNPYMEISGKSGNTIRISGGFDFPVFNSQLNLSVYYDRTRLSGNVFRRDVTGITLTYTLGEKFYKVKL